VIKFQIKSRLQGIISKRRLETSKMLIFEGDSGVRKTHRNVHRQRGLCVQEQFGDNI
jgi:hypothetical protein